jgi:hypothetical protein
MEEVERGDYILSYAGRNIIALKQDTFPFKTCTFSKFPYFFEELQTLHKSFQNSHRLFTNIYYIYHG